MDKKLRAKLNALADAMQPQIDAKRNPGVANQNPTARRARIASSMYDDARRMENVQQALRGLAKARRLPALLQGLTSRAAVEAVLGGYYCKPINRWKEPCQTGKRILAAGLKTEAQFKKAHKLLVEYVIGPDPEVVRKLKIKELTNSLIGTKIPGFFPTPRPLAVRLVDTAGIGPGMTVLEPSAGCGNIADAVRDMAPAANLTVVEISCTLNEILEAKGYYPEQMDFLEKRFPQFDRIVMNPPFEDCQDIDHVRHAFELLRPGGRLVSIMGEHAFFCDDKKSQEFRQWLSRQHCLVDKLESGTFTGADALRQTSVASRVVVIDKHYS